MTRDRLVDEIREAQLAIRRSEAARSPAPATAPLAAAPTSAASAPTPPRDPRASLRHLISELAMRLDRTQEQLLARLGDLNQRSRQVAAVPASAESGLLEEILERLGAAGPAPLDSRLDERLTSLDSHLRTLGVELAGQRTTPSDLDAKLDALESAIRSAGCSAASSAEITALAAKIESLPPRSSQTPGAGGDPAIDASTLASLEKRLDAIEERLGGDAGAVTLGAALSRLGERLDRIESALATPGAVPPREGLASLDERIDRILETSLEHRGGTDEARKTIATLKRDFSLLVHTINGHLQESRHRSDQIEGSLEELKAALHPIARHVGLELGEA